MQISAKTHVGLLRNANEDNYVVCSAPTRQNCYLIVVADGMGGHKAGEVASEMAVNSLKKCFLSSYQTWDGRDFGQMERVLTDMVVAVNEKVYEAALLNEDYQGMGTTITMGIIVDQHLCIAHVGDSRAYLLRDGLVSRLTEDHSLVGELVTKGELTELEASHHPQRNILTRALGSDGEITVDIRCLPIQANDVLIFATDGLTNLVTSEEIETFVEGTENLDQCAQLLISVANERGGPDNITVVLVRC